MHNLSGKQGSILGFLPKTFRVWGPVHFVCIVMKRIGSGRFPFDKQPLAPLDTSLVSGFRGNGLSGIGFRTVLDAEHYAARLRDFDVFWTF